MNLLKVIITGIVLVLQIIVPPRLGSVVRAQETALPVLIISELKARNDATTTSSSTGLDEFIEIHNPGSSAVSLNDYFIGYINTANPSSSQQFDDRAIAQGLLEPGSSLILAKNETDVRLPGAIKSPFSSLSDSGGSLRLTDSNNNVIDQLAWSSTACAPIALLTCAVLYLPGTTATKSQSFTRSKTDGQYDLINPTWQLTVPSPLSSELTPMPAIVPDRPTPDPAPDSTLPDSAGTEQPVVDGPPAASQPGEPSDTTPIVGNPGLPPQITELLPNPAAPASDSVDEFIELYNPNDQPIVLTGYKLQSGNTFSYSYTFPVISLAGREYRAFKVTETGTILSNTSGQVRLLDPSGGVVGQTNSYDDALEGQAWAIINGVWQWTTSPSANGPNILTKAELKPVGVIKPAAAKTSFPKTAVTKTSAAKTPSTKKASTKSKAAAKTAAAKTAKTTPARKAYQDPAAAPATLHPGILAGVGIITLLYAAYEYRHDAVNAIRRLRRYREIRRATRAQA